MKGLPSLTKVLNVAVSYGSVRVHALEIFAGGATASTACILCPVDGSMSAIYIDYDIVAHFFTA